MPRPFPFFGEQMTMTRGRKPAWAELVNRLDGSTVAKARLRALLETLAGRQTVAAACLGLGLSERRFHALRDRILQAGLAGLEPRPAGRPGGPGAARQTPEAAMRELRI